MADRLVDISNPEALVAEVERMRAEIARLEERVALLDRLAHQDPLIDLPNRRGFMRQLESLIARVSRHGEPAAMLFVDIDGLKGINDTFGHPVGDEALIYISRLLVSGVRKSDCVARIGGDEFGILLERADEACAKETAERIAAKVSDCEFCHANSCLPLSVAIGIGMIGGDDDPDSVIARADLAMYRDKGTGA